MAEMPNTDPNFEPQSRPRSDTWPMNRPNIPPRRRMQEMPGTSTMLSTTFEEGSSQEFLDQSMMLEPPPPIKDDYLQMLSPGSMPTDLDNMLLGLPTAPSASLVEDYPSMLSSGNIKTEPNNNNLLTDYCTTTTITELSTLSGDQSFEDIQQMQPMPGQIGTPNAVFSTSTTSHSKSPTSTTVSTPQSSTATTSGATPKAKSTRKNAWGNMSYADLITQAIESSPEKRLTLAQIYEWMVKNVPYFKDKGDSNSSAGWKNSIRHNLSLHAKFKRIQNEGTGKSSWWVINHDAKPGKSPRRRAISMDNQNAKSVRQRSKLAKQKAELLKKQKAGVKAGENSSWGRDGSNSIETAVSKAMGSEYRVRASSNASSIGGRISPSHLFPPQDLDDEGPLPLSPLGSATNLANLSTSLPSAFDIFNQGQRDNTPSAITESGLGSDLLESFTSMDVVSSPMSYPGEPVDSKAGMFLQQLNGGQQNSNRKNLSSNVAQNSPNLASLLQKNTKTPPKTTSAPIVKREQDWNDSKPQYGYPEYQSPPMMNVMQSQPQFKTQVQPRYVLPQQTLQDGTQFSQNVMRQQNPSVQQQQVSYVQPSGIQQYLQAQQRQQQMVPETQQPPPQYPDDQSNLLQMGQAKFPSDINLDSPFLDSRDLDMNEALRSIPLNDYNYNFGGMEFESGGKPASFYTQTQMQESNDYSMGSNSMMQQPPPVMHPNPDVFIANQGPGTTSMDMMMDSCRINNNNFQRSMQTGQTSSVGAASTYTLQ